MVTPYDLDLHGGVQQHVSHLADELRRGGDEVVVLGPARHDSDGVIAVGRAVPIPQNGSISRVAVSPAAAARTRAVLRRVAPDVVHVHEPYVPVVSLAATMTSPAPIIGTFHVWAESDRSYRLARPMARRIAERVDAWIAVSPAARDFHAGGLGVSPDRFVVVPNGVDVDRFANAEPLAAPVDALPVLLYVGRLAPRKGPDVMLRAYGLLEERGVRARLRVIGDGPMEERIRGMVPSSAQERVELLGRVDGEDLARHYRSATIYVAPSIGGESFGVVLIEAMSAGCPVVASDLPGYASVVTDDVTGVLSPVGDPIGLADRLEALLADEDRRARLVAAGAEEVRQYDWPVVARKVRAVYEGVLAGTA